MFGLGHCRIADTLEWDYNAFFTQYIFDDFLC